MSAAAPQGRLLTGDALKMLRTLPDASADMVLTSPPYFRLRNYQVEGQLGMEATVEQWAHQLHAVSRELHRVLAPTATLWLNLGDTYSTHHSQGAPRKSLLLGPERLAALLIADGWILRNKVIWAKTNPMPTSVRDRFNTAHEYLYVFAKQPEYYFDLDAVRVPHTSISTKRRRPGRIQAMPDNWRGPNGSTATGLARLRAAGRVGHIRGKNPGDVWRIASSNYRGGHHATYPLELARRAILAGCPPSGVVLDPFIGAGTTAVAAESAGRSWIGIELNPEFAAHALRRIAAARQARASPDTPSA